MAKGGVRTVASLSPAATDILLGIGAGDRLVAVSNFESSAGVKGLPRVGDYQTTDWETLARLRPSVMVIQIAPEHLPPGLKQRATELGIELVNIKIDRLDDVFETMRRLGETVGEPQKGTDAVARMRGRLEAVRMKCAARKAVATLIVHDENGQDVIGPDNFLDDLLRIVNARNVAAPLGKAYPTIDRERLVALAPDAVVVLLPDAGEGRLEVARRFWASVPMVPAVRDGHVCTITEGYALVPGPSLADLAERMAACLEWAGGGLVTKPKESK